MTAMKLREELVTMMKRAGYPLTDDQEILLAGALAVWVEKIQRDCLREVLGPLLQEGEAL